MNQAAAAFMHPAAMGGTAGTLFVPEQQLVDPPTPPNASSMYKFATNEVVKRAMKVLIALAAGAVVLVITNVAMAPRKTECATPADCREVRRINTLLSGVKSMVNVIVVLLIVFVAMGAAGVNTFALLATAGVVGLIIGLGAQPAIKSFISGLTFVCADRFSIGDYVMLELPDKASIKGVVTDFTTQTTTVQDFSGARMYVPNGNIVVIVNYSQNEQRAQVDVVIKLQDTDVDRVMQQIRALADRMAVAKPLQGKMTRPPVVKGITANGADNYTVSIAAIAEPMSQVFVERYMRHQLLRLLQRLNVQGDVLPALDNDIESMPPAHDASTMHLDVHDMDEFQT
jgi:small-conductance mechanosensitive channel